MRDGQVRLSLLRRTGRRVNHQLTAPVAFPFFMEITNERETSTWSRLSADRMPLIRIIMGQQAIPDAVGIVTEPEVPSNDVRK